MDITNQTELSTFLSDPELLDGHVSDSISLTSDFLFVTINNKTLSVNNGSMITKQTQLAPVEDEIITDFNLDKDMNIIIYNDNYYSTTTIFNELPDLIDENVIQGDKTTETKYNACMWNDWGDDIFDRWGYFTLYNPESSDPELASKYYFPLFDPLNQEDGLMTTQTFNAFGRTFTIIHGYLNTVGLFKMEITVADNVAFRFGAYGNLGSDENTEVTELSYPYTKNSVNRHLYYIKTMDTADQPNEKFFVYVIPKKTSEGGSKTYLTTFDNDNMSVLTNEVTGGVTIYYSHTNDNKQAVINDVTFSS